MLELFFMAALTLAQADGVAEAAPTLHYGVEKITRERRPGRCTWTPTAVIVTMDGPNRIGATLSGVDATTVRTNAVIPEDRSESGLLADAVHRAQLRLAGCIANAASRGDPAALATLGTRLPDTALVVVLYRSRITAHHYDNTVRTLTVTVEVPLVPPAVP